MVMVMVQSDQYMKSLLKTFPFFRRGTESVVLFCLLAGSSIQAKEIEIEPTLTVGAGYSDNIDREHSNEKSSTYTSVAPGIKFSKEGSRVKSILDYTINGLFYSSESDLNDVQHDLYANVESELVKHSIFLDLNATISQQILDNNKNASSDGVSGSNNLTQTYTYGFAPSWKKKWQNFAESTLQYDYNEVTYSGSNNGNDSQQNKITLNVESGKKFTRYFWNFDYDHSDVSYDRSRDTSSEAYKLKLGYHYSRKLDFTLSTGYEDYDDGRDDGGTGWRAGVIWDPTPRTNLEFEAGHRFFGNTYLLDFKHRSRRFTWHFKYDDSITDTRSDVINNNNNQQETPDGIIVPLTNFTAQYHLSRRMTGDVSYQHKKSTITLGVFNEKRYFEDSDQNDEDDIGLDLSWSLNIGRRTSMNTRLSWEQLDKKRDNNTQDRNTQDRITFSWSLNRSLTPTMSGVLRLSYSENDADIKTDEYKENAISLHLTKTF